VPPHRPLDIITKQAVFAWWEEEDLQAFHPPSGRGLLINLILRSSPEGGKMVNLVVSGNPLYALTGSQLDRLVQKFSADNVSLFLTLKHAKEGTPTTYSEMHLAGPSSLIYKAGTLTYHVSPASFFQPNNYTFPILCETALQMVGPQKHERLIDLFCGLGTLGLYFAPHVDEVVGVEINKGAVADARDNALRSQIDNALFFAEDVTTFIQSYQELFDIALVDPPRAGLEKRGVEALLTLKPKKILYISCNPKTQAQDLQALLPHYTVQKIQPLDQFPHTDHVENFLLLSSNSCMIMKT
jgi:23S rRNA (uracil-5-)-methyltransferase RumA